MSIPRPDIQDHIDQHNRLLDELQAVDYAPPTLKQVTEQLGQVDNRLKEETKQLESLKKATKKEYDEFVAIRDRTSKRIMTKLRHPRSHDAILSEKENKEEKEYIEAFETEQRLTAEIDAMQKQKTQFEQDIENNLKPLATKHDQLNKKLESLYEYLFAGPTPAHPEEDRLEQSYQEALNQYNHMQSQATNESQAYNLLKEADKCLVQAHRSMTDALSASTYDMWGGGFGADMMERSALQDAQMAADRARMFVAQAKNLQPMIGDIGTFVVPRTSMGDVFFDNIFTDMAMHDKIQRSAASLLQAHNGFRNIMSQSWNHLTSLREGQRSAEQALVSARKSLRDARRDIVAAAGQTLPAYTGQAPPGYNQGNNSQPQQYYGNPFVNAVQQ